MNSGLRIEVIYSDPDLVELALTAGNGEFAARTELYESHTACSELAAALDAFPADAKDRRTHQFGTFKPGTGGGGARFELKQRDPHGHWLMMVHMRAGDPGDHGDEATLSLSVEPAGVDLFIAAMRLVSTDVGSSAQLESVAAG